jgi:hypothetical protein
MNGFGLTLGALNYAELTLALIALALLMKRHALGRYKSLTAILMLSPLLSGAFFLLNHYLNSTNRHLSYEIYFYSYWSISIVEAVLMFMFCYEILTRLFSPFPELRSISTRLFGSAVFLCCVVSARFFFIQHMSGARILVAEAVQISLLEGGITFLTAMVIFVSLRPLGLRFRNRLPDFGLGLIFFAAGVFFKMMAGGAPWTLILGGVVICAQLISWIVAIAWPESARQIVSV